MTVLIMSPGGYSNRDFMKVGMAVTVLYLVAVILFVYCFHF